MNNYIYHIYTYKIYYSFDILSKQNEWILVENLIEDCN